VVALLGGKPRFCAAWCVLAPAGAANVYWQQDLVTQVVTFVWAAVPEYGVPGSANTFAVALHGTGAIELVWQHVAMTLAGHDCLVGWSPGYSARDPGPRDLSGALAFATASDSTGLLLNSLQRPVPGGALDLVTRLIPGPVGSGAVVLSFAAATPAIDLAPLGAPGCYQHIALVDTAVFPFPGQPTATTPLRMPAGASWLGTSFVAQACALAPGRNALAVITSNGLRLTLGPY